MDYGTIIIVWVIVRPIIIVLLLAAFVMFIIMLIKGIDFTVGALKSPHRNDPGAKKKLITGIVLTAIPLALAIWIGIGALADYTSEHGVLYNQANSGTVKGMERILKKGVPADCVASGDPGKNVLATGTETTVLGYRVSYYTDIRNERQQYGEKIQLLIDYGADVNRKMCYLSQPDKIETPYLMAIKRGDYGLIELMLKNGANVNEQYPDGTTALDWVNKNIEYYSDENQYNEDILEYFVKIKELLLKYEAGSQTDA